ncbi:MAG: hypothetical protein IPK00_24845 [Deltaproteobacteria bacterium]|nr:hypothetical protein [Deltaproteobacteria bacterium]
MAGIPLSSRHELVLALILVVGAVGCAGGGPKTPTAAELAGTNAKVVVVAPLNVASALPIEIEGSSEIVATTLVAYLEEHGKTVRKLGFRGGRDLWVAATRQVDQSGQRKTFENAASVYAREIAKHVEYDVLIVPTLYIQNAQVRSRFVRWDGTRELVRIEGRRVLSKRRTIFDSMHAGMRAASMMAAVFAADGTVLQTGNRGLQAIEHVQLSDGKGVDRDESFFSIEPNSPPLDDPVKIRAGIAAALSPFLPELAPVEETIEARGGGTE